MGKPSKKSATKVEAAAPPAAVVAVSKSGKKGKREAENEIGKAVSAKKQKKDVAVVQAIEKTKTEAKTPKKKVEESSSSEEESDDSSSEDEKPAPKAAVPAKKPVSAAKKAESSSSEESSSDESEDEKPAAKAAPVKNGTVTKKVESSDSSEESEEESDEDEAPKPKAATKAPQAVTKTVKKESSSSDDSSDEELEDDDETPAKVTAPAAKKAAPTPAKKAEASSSSEESDSDQEDDSDGSSDDEDAKPKKAAPAAKAPAKAAKKESSSDESDEEDSSDEESSEEDEPAKTPKKKDTDVEMVDAETKSAKKAPATPATPDVSTSKTLFAGNLSFRIEQSDVEEFFKECGEVVDVRFATDPDGQFKGFGHVEFATAEAAKKALELNGGDLAGRPVRLDLARERGEKGAYTPQSGKENSYQRGGQGQSQSIFVRGFDTSEGEDKIREALQNHFGACGEMTRCSIPPDRETGGVKGMAYIDFADPSGISKALELDGSDIGGGCYLTVNEAKPREPRGDFGGGRGGGRFDSGGRRGGGRFDSGGRRGGRFDSGGRRGGRDSGGRRGGRGGFNKPNLAAAGTGKKTTFNNDD